MSNEGFFYLMGCKYYYHYYEHYVDNEFRMYHHRNNRIFPIKFKLNDNSILYDIALLSIELEFKKCFMKIK